MISKQAQQERRAAAPLLEKYGGSSYVLLLLLFLSLLPPLLSDDAQRNNTRPPLPAAVVSQKRSKTSIPLVHHQLELYDSTVFIYISRILVVYCLCLDDSYLFVLTTTLIRSTFLTS